MIYGARFQTHFMNDNNHKDYEDELFGPVIFRYMDATIFLHLLGD
jgi:hypothetical protein